MPNPDYTPDLDSALAALLPGDVKYSVCRIPKDYTFEFQNEADCLKSAGDYRKREFTAGRNCARSALEQLGIPRSALPPDDHGVPGYPDGAVACISHSRDYCAAIAARDSAYRALGLDLEMTNRLGPSAIGRTVHPDEKAFVQGDQKKATLIFCAKETFFKAQFPLWQTYANFQDLAFNINEQSGSMTIGYIDERFPSELRALSGQIEFRFRFFQQFVVTLCWLKV